MTAPLFREEALRRFRVEPWQPPLLSRPVSGASLTLFSLLAVAGLVVFAASFEFARKEHAAGHLTPTGGWSRVTVRYPAVVGRRFVEAGDVVEAGDALFELRASQGIEAGVSVANRLLGDVEQRRRALEERIAATEARYASEALLMQAGNASAEREAEHLAAEVESHEARLAIAKRQYAQGVRLRRSGAIPEGDLLALADRVQSRLAAVGASRRQLSETKASLAAHGDRVRRLEHDREVALASERDQLHALAMEEARLDADESGRLLAPRGGRIGSVRAQAGDFVRQGDVLLDIMPLDATLKARLYVPSAAIGAVEIGQEVRIHLDAFPYERHGAQVGRVQAVSATTLPLGYGDPHVGAMTEGFQVDVEFPDGFVLLPNAGRSLRPGMTLSADIVTEYATPVDWLLAPLKGAAQRL